MKSIGFLGCLVKGVDESKRRVSSVVFLSFLAKGASSVFETTDLTDVCRRPGRSVGSTT